MLWKGAWDRAWAVPVVAQLGGPAPVQVPREGLGQSRVVFHAIMLGWLGVHLCLLRPFLSNGDPLLVA